MSPRAIHSRLFLVLLTLIVLSGTTSFISAQCAYDAATDSWGCGTLDDALDITTSVSGRISMDDGSDTLTIDSASRIGGSSTVTNAAVLMGDGDDSVYNDGTIGALFDMLMTYHHQRGLDCGAGNDIVVNAGLIDGSVACGEGDDTVINLPGAGALVIQTTAGNDSLVNGGYLGNLTGPTVLFLQQGDLVGGDGNDTLVNQPFATADGDLVGGNGADSVVNGGYVVESLWGDGIMDGDATPGNDTLVNAAGAYARYGIRGGAGNDSVVNSGHVFGTLEGGGQDDTVINAAGAYAGALDASAGNDSLYNAGYVGSIGSPHQRNGHMAGGSNDDRLINEAGAVLLGSIHGDPGNDYVFNGGYAGLGLAGDSSVYGGTGSDTVINAASGYTYMMDGDDGDDSL